MLHPQRNSEYLNQLYTCLIDGVAWGMLRAGRLPCIWTGVLVRTFAGEAPRITRAGPHAAGFRDAW